MLSVKVIGPVYRTAFGETPLPPGELIWPASSLAEMIKSELVVETFRP